MSIFRKQQGFFSAVLLAAANSVLTIYLNGQMSCFADFD